MNNYTSKGNWQELNLLNANTVITKDAGSTTITIDVKPIGKKATATVSGTLQSRSVSAY